MNEHHKPKERDEESDTKFINRILGRAIGKIVAKTGLYRIIVILGVFGVPIAKDPPWWKHDEPAKQKDVVELRKDVKELTSKVGGLELNVATLTGAINGRLDAPRRTAYILPEK